MAGLSDLDFLPGLEIEKIIHGRFKCSVSSPNPSSPFVLVASFGRSAVKLNVDSVGLLLQSCVGGSAQDFKVLHLSGWMFRFTVSCKNAGILIYNLKSYSCKFFSIFFFLWGNGGPNWINDYRAWCSESEAEWTLVGPKGKPIVGNKPTFAEVTRSSFPNNRQSVFKRLFYPSDYNFNFLPRSSVHRRSSVLNPPDLRKKADYRWIPKLPVSSSSAGAFNANSEVSPAVSPHLETSGLNSNSSPLGPQASALCFSCYGPGSYKKAQSNIVKCLYCIKAESAHEQPGLFWKTLPLPPPFSADCARAQSGRNPRPTVMEGEAAIRNPPFLLPSEASSEILPPPYTVPPSAQPEPEKTPTMANFAVDPRPHVPHGWELELPPA